MVRIGFSPPNLDSQLFVFSFFLVNLLVCLLIFFKIFGFRSFLVFFLVSYFLYELLDFFRLGLIVTLK